MNILANNKASRLKICATSFLSASGAAAFPFFVAPDPSPSGLGLCRFAIGRTGGDRNDC